MRLGTSDEARLIGKHPYGKRSPNGWRKLGEGGSRAAYLAPSGVVYKVPHWESNSETNLDEVKNAKALRKHSKNLWKWDVKIPHFTPYKAINFENEEIVVNAVEFLPSSKPVKCNAYKGDGYWTNEKCNCRKFGTPHQCFGSVWEHLEVEYGLIDVWESNLSYNNRFIHVIDLGEY